MLDSLRYLKDKNNTHTIFLIDILYMKDINYVYVYKNCDLVISQVLKLLNEIVKNEIPKILNKILTYKLKHLYIDIFEFKIYANLSLKKIQKIKDIILLKIEEHDFYLDKDNSININLTIGCTKGKIEDLRIYAEKALNNAKLNYSDFAYFDPHFFNEQDNKSNLIKTLQYNISEKKVEPYLQKIVSCKDQSIYKYEALMRVFDKDGSILYPAVFIEKSKKFRLYTKLMAILIKKVSLYIRKYKINISINLDFSDMLNPKLKKIIIDELKNNHIGEMLTIEILESQKITNYELVNDFIQEVKGYGVKIAIDDFGSGFSNYDNILNLNIDYIKIDGSLIKNIDTDIYRSLIKSIVDFSKLHKIKVVAEFVSDLKILRYVKTLDIDYAQGYYFNKPQHIEEILGEKNEK